MNSVSSKSAAHVRYGIRAVIAGFNTGKPSSDHIGFGDLYSIFHEQGEDAEKWKIQAAKAVWKTGATPAELNNPNYSIISQNNSNGFAEETTFLNGMNKCISDILIADFKGRLNTAGSELTERISNALEQLDNLPMNSEARQKLFDVFRESIIEASSEQPLVSDYFNQALSKYNLYCLDDIFDRLGISSTNIPELEKEEISHSASPSL